MNDLLRYPGKHRIRQIAEHGELTCWFGAGLVIGICTLLFLPLSQMQGKSIVHVYPLLVPWVIGAVAILGALPGYLFRRTLLRMRVDDWLVGGPIDPGLPLAAERAIRPVSSIWLIGLPAVILAHHRVTHGGDGALITRLWIKIAVAVLLTGVIRAALAQRVHYELAGG